MERLQPLYVFYAHHHGPVPPAAMGRAYCVWLNDVNFEDRGPAGFDEAPVEPGCMAVLRWRSPDEHSFGLVDETWFHGVNRSNWAAFSR